VGLGENGAHERTTVLQGGSAAVVERLQVSRMGTEEFVSGIFGNG